MANIAAFENYLLANNFKPSTIRQYKSIVHKAGVAEKPKRVTLKTLHNLRLSDDDPNGHKYRALLCYHKFQYNKPIYANGPRKQKIPFIDFVLSLNTRDNILRALWLQQCGYATGTINTYLDAWLKHGHDAHGDYHRAESAMRMYDPKQVIVHHPLIKKHLARATP
jgi:hypothetical protein